MTGPLRSSQKFILNKWFEESRDSKDSIIKLDTGQGKTLIGLLILQSLLNSNEGPC
ncbi:DEAD/DEAH box helicase family protein, partial [Mycobacterium tuberculosis]|uniref:DEAD/DEAH box helicase family protein n=2 Tax=Bacillati TaxID=1783272 RepID=UPI003306DAC8